MTHYNVDINSNIPPELRGPDPYTLFGTLPKNHGLYSGKDMKIKHAIPTTTYFMQKILPNNNPTPPPEAKYQYPTPNRLGNNYSAMPGTYWYNPSNKKGLYNIIGTK